jgi:NAD(P)H-flavin reductase
MDRLHLEILNVVSNLQEAVFEVRLKDVKVTFTLRFGSYVIFEVSIHVLESSQTSCLIHHDLLIAVNH